MAESKEDLREQQLGEAGKSEDHKIKAQTEFTVVDVSSALEAYMGSLKEDTGVKIALTSHAPKVQGFVVTLEVDNDFLLGKVTDLHPSLLAYLMKRLNNGFVTLNVQVHAGVDEGQDKKRLFTAKDKFEHFIELNPAVGELKALFGLEIE